MRYSRQHSTICVALTDAGWIAGVGAKRGVDPREMAKSDLIVVWGGNPVSTQVNVMTQIAQARRERGAKLVVVDPYRTGTAELADLHLALLPGHRRRARLRRHACAVQGRLRRPRLSRALHRRSRPGSKRISRAARPPGRRRSPGLPEAQIVDFARLYGGTKRSFIRLGYGFSRQRNGAMQMFAVTCLPAVTGAWQYEGGGALYSQHVIVRLDRTLIEGLDLLDPATRILDQSRIGPILSGDRRDLGDGPPVTALFVQNTNPMVVSPDSALVHKGLRARRSVRLRARAVHDRDRGDGRHRLAGDDLSRARRHLHRRRPHLSADRPRGAAASCRMPLEPRCRLRPRRAARREPSGVRDDRASR